MKKIFALSGALLIVLATSAAYDCHCHMLNPYEPYNAVAAEPIWPYDISQMPRVSRTFYVPCPSWTPWANQLPDVPPVWQPFPGPYGIPVSVP